MFSKIFCHQMILRYSLQCDSQLEICNAIYNSRLSILKKLLKNL